MNVGRIPHFMHSIRIQILAYWTENTISTPHLICYLKYFLSMPVATAKVTKYVPEIGVVKCPIFPFNSITLHNIV
jgi:hypothetical protein